MSKVIEKIPCQKCGSSKTPALAVYENKDGDPTGFCYSCRTPFSNPYTGVEMTGKPKTPFPKIPEESIEWIPLATGFNTIPDRHLNKSTCIHFGIRTTVDETTGKILQHYYPKTKSGVVANYKKRDVETKSFYSIGDGKDLELFGQAQCTGPKKVLIITEGELDAPSVWQMMRKVGKNVHTVSVNNGAGVDSIKTNYEFVNAYPSILLCMDQDKPGEKAAKQIAEMFEPGKVKFVTIPHNDPNDMLMAREEAEFARAISTAVAHRPDGIVGVKELLDLAMKPPVWGLSYPWPTLTKATYGIREGELIGIGAGGGSGKTEAFKEIINWLLNVHKLCVGLIFLEEPAHKTLKVLAGKKRNKRYHIPDGDWCEVEMREDILSLTDKIYLYDSFGAKDWETIKKKIRYMVSGLGLKHIFLDHLTALVAQEDNEYKALNKIMEELASLCVELSCTIFFISHLTKADGTPHEEGGRVTKKQFKGSGAIDFWSHQLFGIERNQQAEDIEERNTSVFRVLKEREVGLGTGTTFKLLYNHDTGMWQEKNEDDFGDAL